MQRNRPKIRKFQQKKFDQLDYGKIPKDQIFCYKKLQFYQKYTFFVLHGLIYNVREKLF